MAAKLSETTPSWPGIELFTLPPASPLQAPACAAFAHLARAFQSELEALGVSLTSFQAFDAEMAALPGRYAPAARGGLWLALVNHYHNGRDLSQSPLLAGLPLLHLGCRGPFSVVGCLALRDLGGGAGELKRMFVAPPLRGHGVGRLLLDAALAAAAGCYYYDRLLLDTLGRLPAAARLYEAAGFERTDAYCENPLEDAIFMRKELAVQAARG
jgi:GNAT superfamily N-acetyltransferase